MKIQSVYTTNNPIPSQNFNGLHVINPQVQRLLLTSLDSKQLGSLSEMIKAQQNNSVHILLDSKDGKRLNASLASVYRLKDFQTKYKQKILFESKFQFIKRVVNVAEKYKKQIQDFEVVKLKWDYPMLLDWVNKMYF